MDHSRSHVDQSVARHRYPYHASAITGMRALISQRIYLIASLLLSLAAHAEPKEVRVTPPKCGKTRIETIGKRLETEDHSLQGTVITYANGIMGISYDLIPAIAEHSKIGDKVKLCLIAKYVDCPKGDNRGRTYRATNLRTSESWELMDSQHVCGGA